MVVESHAMTTPKSFGASRGAASDSSSVESCGDDDTQEVPVDCPGTACRSPGLSHSHVRSAIHCRASEFNKTQSHERSLMAIRANRDFRKEPGGL
jgi:hypothetical protein